MKYVKQMVISTHMSVGQIVNEMSESGVLGAGRLARAVDIMVEIFKKSEYSTFLCLAGPMVPGGLREIFHLLIEKGYVDAIVTSGANIVHDIIEALGYKGEKGNFSEDDIKLRRNGIGRAGDIFFEQEGFQALEKKVYEVCDSLIVEENREVAVYELLQVIGKSLDDEKSLLKSALKRGVPVFSPAIMDSMLGLHIWTYSQLKKIRINPVLDLNRMADFIFESEKLGAIILGGGVPKHFALAGSILREGVDAAVQIIMDRPESGSLSGAELEEAISWKKARTESKLATVIGDATIIFPIMVAAVFEKLSKPKNQN